ncbi:cytochrome c [Erwinia persicina]|uniref:c-type cytochrome n=1 Tax=Erwinia persicina TaxID=55211 RepID=UPI0016540211|nr:cytochrome c [Erwinia persicina]MBC3946020.1 cytochrome c [Erwinia persicina]
MKRVIFSLMLLAGGPTWAMSPGEYVAKAGDCTACHTAPGGVPMAGGLRFATPVGDIYSTNITPDKQHGIGRYTFAEFDRAMRQGVARDGHRLYPAMPYTAYAKMSEADMRALYDFLLREVPASSQANRDSDIPWLLSARWPLGIWNVLFHEDHRYQPDAQQSAQWNRGAYLVQGAGHCGSCHTPRGWGMQEQALDQQGESYLSGAELDGWYAPSLRGLPVEELVALLKTGRSAQGAVAGPMADVVTHSTQYLTEADLSSIAVYLRSLPAAPAARSQPATPSAAGAKTYAMYCSTCHGSEGEGNAHTIPALAGNATLTADNALTALRVVLDGAETPVTQQGMAQTMPGYGWALNDVQMAELMNYVRHSWGNQAAGVKPEQVAEARHLKEK